MEWGLESEYGKWMDDVEERRSGKKQRGENVVTAVQ